MIFYITGVFFWTCLLLAGAAGIAEGLRATWKRRRGPEGGSWGEGGGGRPPRPVRPVAPTLGSVEDQIRRSIEESGYALTDAPPKEQEEWLDYVGTLRLYCRIRTVKRPDVHHPSLQN